MANWTGPGLGDVGSYQVAARPFVKQHTPILVGSNGDGANTDGLFANNLIVDDASAALEFPSITRRLVIKNNTDGNLLIYFCSLMVPVNRAGAADLKEDNAEFAGNPCARGNRITPGELAQYHNGANDNRPNSAVKINKHYYILPTTKTLDIDVKCRKVFIVNAAGANAADCDVLVEMTDIDQEYDLDFRGLEGISGGAKGTQFLKGQQHHD